MKKAKKNPHHVTRAGRGSTSSRTSPVACRALMVVDSSKLRRKVFTDCRRARTTFEKAEMELRHFEQVDKPAFVRWYRGEMGPILSELEELLKKINDLRLRLMLISQFAQLKPCSNRQAASFFEKDRAGFERMLEELLAEARRQDEIIQARMQEEIRRQLKSVLDAVDSYLSQRKQGIQKQLRRGVSPFEVVGELMYGFCCLKDLDYWTVQEALHTPEGETMLKAHGLWSDQDERDEDAADLFDQVFGEGSEEDWDAEPVGWFDSPKADSKAGTGGEDDAIRLKGLYRELAFGLHPDQSGSGTDPAKLALWHQVQDAMERRDLDRLEVLHAHMMMLRGEASEGMPVSRLMGLTQMYRASREALRRTIRSLRHNPEWGFQKRSDAQKAAMKCYFVEDLQGQKHEGLAVLRGLEQDYRWMSGSRPSAP